MDRPNGCDNKRETVAPVFSGTGYLDVSGLGEGCA